MGTWADVLSTLRKLQEAGHDSPYDALIAGAIANLHQFTGRNTIVYATAHLQSPQVRANLLSIVHEDVQGFMECVYGLEGGELDLILHSSGGAPEAAEAIVQYLRDKFSDIRVIVPQMAMSAATMIACAGDRIVMGRHSSLGPIDPQFAMQTELGFRLVPAQTVLDQFDKAKEECGDQKTLSVWYPILKQYGPALLVQCENAIERSKQLVGEWLADHMFATEADGEETANGIANVLAAHDEHLAHGRPLGKDFLRDIGLVVEDLEEPQEFQDAVLTLYHALMIAFDQTPAVKVVLNHNGRRWVKLQGQVQSGAQQNQAQSEAIDENGGPGCVSWIPFIGG